MFHFLIRYHMACPGVRKATLHHTFKRKLAQDFFVCCILRLRLDYILHFLLHNCHWVLSLGLAAPGDLLTFAESARLLVADTSGIGAGVHKQIVGTPYTQRTLSFNHCPAHRHPYLT